MHIFLCVGENANGEDTRIELCVKMSWCSHFYFQQI